MSTERGVNTGEYADRPAPIPADVALELFAFVKEWLADWTAAGPTDSPREAQASALIDRAEGK